MKSRFPSAILAASLSALPGPLLAADRDRDGLEDSYETNTGVYVSPTNTGTSPGELDSDNDGAGDWYEVAASFTDPNDPDDKPNIPYPLPAPDGSAGTTGPGAPPVKIYILSGQSNMVGHGNISPLGTAGTLETVTMSENKFPNLVNRSAWRVRNDVIYRGVVSANGNNGPLAPGQGTSTTAIGPELGFGHVMGYHHDEPVLIIKASQGGKDIGWDFLPPGSVPFDWSDGYTYAGFRGSPKKWITGTRPVSDGTYAGYQFEQCFMDEGDWRSRSPYPAVTNVVDILDAFDTEFPQWAEQGFEIAGFAWFHGWNDGLSSNAPYANHYKRNIAQFIREIRSYYVNRYPGGVRVDAPFVIATAAFNGWDEGYLDLYPTRRTVLNAQLAMGDPAQYPEFDGNVKTMEARSYWREVAESPANQSYHYNRNAETYLLVGDALGRGMIELLDAANSFDAWIAGFDVGGLTGFEDDPDFDGIPSGLENYFGTPPDATSTGVVAGESAGGGFTFSHPIGNTPASDLTARYRWSADLVSFHDDGQSDGNGTTVGFSPGTPAGGRVGVTATVTGTPVEKLFVVIEATQN
jgi:alpha-galactosidase